MSQLVWRSAHHLTDFDGKDERRATRSRRARGFRRDLIGALGAVDLDDPVAREEFLRLRERPIRYRHAVLTGANELRLAWRRQPLGGDVLAGLLELLVELVHEADVILEVVGRPAKDLIIAGAPGRVHHQTACHRDLPYQHFVSSRPLAISALFCVDPFTHENGATVVLPGTHRIEQFPSDTLAKEIERPVEAPAGSFLVFDSMLFHRAGHNRSTAMRRAVNHVYALPFIGQQISMPDVLQGRYADDPALRRLFGYDTKPVPSVDDWWARRRARR